MTRRFHFGAVVFIVFIGMPCALVGVLALMNVVRGWL